MTYKVLDPNTPENPTNLYVVGDGCGPLETEIAGVVFEYAYEDRRDAELLRDRLNK